MNTKKLTPEIRNPHGEKLDTWVEIPESDIKATVIMVHGFGTDKHETAGYFDDISRALVNNQYRVVRFDFSGYGSSEGKQEDNCYIKEVEDLNSILSWVKAAYTEPMYIFAQSMGCWVTALANPDDISKTIMTGVPNSNPQVVVDRVKSRFGSRQGAKLDLASISLIPRSTGKIQKIGPQFWQDLLSLHPVEIIKAYSQKTKLFIVHWNNDEIIGKDFLKEYDAIPGIKIEYLPGTHSVINPEDRNNFIGKMLEFYG